MAYILNLYTFTKNCSVSLLKGNKIVNIIEQEDDSYRHSELLTSFIDQILSKEKISTENLSAVSVSKGPGSFTGLRIGFSVAKGLCFPYNIPIIGITPVYPQDEIRIASTSLRFVLNQRHLEGSISVWFRVGSEDKGPKKRWSSL